MSIPLKRGLFTPEEDKSMWNFFVSELRRSNPDAITIKNTLWKTYMIEMRKRGKDVKHTHSALEKHFRIILPHIANADIDERDILFILQKSKIILADIPKSIKKLEKRLACTLVVEPNGYVKKVIPDASKNVSVEKRLQVNFSNIVDINPNSESSSFSEHPTLQVPDNTQQLLNNMNVDYIENLNPTIKLEVCDPENDKLIQKSNQLLTTELLLALNNLSSSRCKWAKGTIRESPIMPDQLSRHEFTPERVFNVGITIPKRELDDTMSDLTSSNLLPPPMPNFEIPIAINMPVFRSSTEEIHDQPGTSNAYNLNKQSNDYEKVSDDEKELHRKLSNFNWNNMKPSEVENFKKLIRIRIKMIISRELKPENLLDNLPRKLCAKIDKIPETLKWMMN